MTYLLDAAREAFHQHLLAELLTIDSKGIATNADVASNSSKAIAKGIVDRIGRAKIGVRLKGQIAGKRFEQIVQSFLSKTFLQFDHLRPGEWEIVHGSGRKGSSTIATCDQYEHLDQLQNAAKEDPLLAASLGNDYVVAPDIMIVRHPVTDSVFNAKAQLVSTVCGRDSAIRVGRRPSLHASVSCKWTIRSDRSQNARSEGLSLTRNRKGRSPHITVVTAEPLPQRLASIALGTGDIDCVYHFALYELVAAVEEIDDREARNVLRTLTNGKRLKDISDLPLDLLI